MNKTLIVNRSQCSEILSIERCIPSMEEALKAIANGNSKVLGRSMIPHANGNMLAIMPASDLNAGVTGAKVIIFPGKETALKGSNQGIIPLFSVDDGSLKAIIDAELITVVRTAATSAAATKILANKDAKTVAILGSGKQGRAHAEAMTKVRDIKTVYMWDISLQAAQSACVKLAMQCDGVEFIRCETAKEAVINADIICTTTPGRSKEAIIKKEWLKKGVHINAVGACSPVGREIDADTIFAAKIFTDWNTAVKSDSGDLLLAVSEKGREMPELTEIGKVLAEGTGGRNDHEEITLFESVGISVEDIAAADMIYNFAKDNDIGTYVEI